MHQIERIIYRFPAWFSNAQNALNVAYLLGLFGFILLHMVIDGVPVEIVLIHQVIIFFASVDIPLVTLAWLILKICFISDSVLFVGIPFPLGNFCWLVKPIERALLSIHRIEFVRLLMEGVRCLEPDFVVFRRFVCGGEMRFNLLHIDLDFSRGFGG